MSKARTEFAEQVQRLFERLRAGDEPAQSALWALVRQPLTGILRSRGIPWGDADSLALSAFEELWWNRSSVRRSGWNYLVTVCRNAVRKWRLELSSRSTLSPEALDRYEAAAAPSEEDWICAGRWLDRQTPESRVLIDALSAANGSRTGAAKTLGVSVRTVQRRVHELRASYLRFVDPG